MPWAAVAAVGAASAVAAKDGPADLPALIEKPNCEGCGAPTVPHAAVCAYCNRPKEAAMLNWFRRTANRQTPLQVSKQAQMEQMRRRLASPSRTVGRSPTTPAPSPTPDYSAPFAAAAFSGAFSSSADSGGSCSSGVSAESSGVSSSSCSLDSSSFSSGGGGDFGGGGASGEY